MKPTASSSNRHSDRRQFVLKTAGLGAASWAAITAKTQAAAESTAVPFLKPGDTILMQGDSITDARRDRDITDKPNHQPAMGGGYAWLAASQALVSRPQDKLKFHNRGISGNKVYQLAERWDKDCLDLKPDVLSILIGVNDIWHKLNGNYDGTVEIYEKDYKSLLEYTARSLPSVKLVVCEPFVLRCGAVKDNWFPEFDEYRAAARRVADAYGARFVPFQAMFDKAIEYAPPEHWAKDGVHPSSFGASLMAHTWLETVGA